jgi:hypothetical protein
MTRQEIADHTDDDDFDEHGIIRDGRSIRVPALMMDAKKLFVAPLQQTSTVPLEIKTGLTGEFALKRYFYSDGTRKPSRQVRDREREQRRKAAAAASAADAAAKAVTSFDAQYGGPHRPGYRFADTTDSTTVDARATAYNEYCADLQTRWMTPAQKAQHIADAQRATADAAPDGVDAREWERSKMTERAVWKGGANPTDAMSFLQKSARDNAFWQQDIQSPKTEDVAAARSEMIDHVTQQWRTQDAAAVENLPFGRYPISAGEGNPCTINGEIGTLQREGDYLVCRATPIGPTRSGESAGDAVLTSRAALDAISVEQGQAIKDAAYNEMCAELRDAWKKQG